MPDVDRVMHNEAIIITYVNISVGAAGMSIQERDQTEGPGCRLWGAVHDQMVPIVTQSRVTVPCKDGSRPQHFAPAKVTLESSRISDMGHRNGFTQAILRKNIISAYTFSILHKTPIAA